MKELKIFYLQHCPYCRKAMRAFEELKSGNPAYGETPVEWVEETEFPQIADAYDYYRVPSIFCGEKKLYECSPSDGYDEIKSRLKRALDTAAE